MLKRLLSQAKQKIDRSFNQFVASVFVASQLLFPMLAITPAHATNDEKVRICHATSSGSNPFTSNEVNDDAIDGNGNGSSDHNRNDHQDGEDIIPPFYVNGDPGTWASRNWDAEGQAIWNNDCSIKGSIKVIKDTQPDDVKNFDFNINQDGSGLFDDFELEDDGNNNDGDENYKVFNNLSKDDYVITEDNEDEWKLDSIVCEGAEYEVDLEDNKATVKLDKAENAECTFVNKLKPTFGSVKVNKRVDADGNGVYEGSNGTADSLGFAWGIDAETADNDMGDIQSNIPTGQHTVNENSVSGYAFTGWYFTEDQDDEINFPGDKLINCENPQHTTLPAQIEVKKNDKTEITLCNQAIRGGDIVVTKLIDADGNLNTDDRTPGADWQFNIAGTAKSTNGEGQATVENVPVGDNHSVTETVKDGYKILSAKCDGGQNGQFNLNTKAVEGVQVEDDETVYCTFINALKPATLHVTKIVCDKEDSLPNWGFGANETIGAATASNFLGENQACEEADWNFQWVRDADSSSNPGDESGVAGGPWSSPFSDSTQIPAGGKVWVREVFQSGYIGFSGQNTTEDESAELYCSSDVLNYDNWEFIENVQPGEDYYCVAWNVLERPTLTVKKEIVNQGEWGGELEVTDFPLYVDGQLVVHNVPTDSTQGFHVIWEDQQDGYDVIGFVGDCFGLPHIGIGITNLGASGEYTCTIQNEEKPASVTVYKKVRNDNGGHKQPWQFDLLLNGYEVDHGEKTLVPRGQHTISEDQEFGYELEYIKCYVKDKHWASVHDLLDGKTDDWDYIGGDQGENDYVTIDLELDEHAVCVVKNDDIPPVVKVKKITYDGGHFRFISEEKFDFEVKNLFHGWDKEEFKLDTNPFTPEWYIDNEEEVEMHKAGLIKVSEDEVEGWTTFAKCFKHDRDIRELENSIQSNQFGGGEFLTWLNNYEIEYVGVGETLHCVFLNIEEGDVKVTKFHDTNENGHWDDGEGEAALPGWDITLSKKIGSFELKQYGPKQTDEDGEVKFRGLLPNPIGILNYELSEDLQEGWRQTNIYCEDDYRNGNDLGVLNTNFVSGHHSGGVEVRPGEKTECFIGNVRQAQLQIDKSNDATDALTPGQTVNFTINVTNPDDSSHLEDVMVHDLLPLGLSYVDGTALVDDEAATFETEYAPGVEAVWAVGSLAPGQTKTLTYTVIVDDNTGPGIYTNIAWTLGFQCSRYDEIEPEYEPELPSILSQNENNEHDNNEFACVEFESPVLGNVGPVDAPEENDEVSEARLFSLLAVAAVTSTSGDPFVYSSVTVAAVLGVSDVAVLAETGSPAILAPFVGLGLIGLAGLGLVGSGAATWRRVRRFVQRFSRGLAVGVMTLGLLTLSYVPALAAAGDFWTLRVADLSGTTSASSLTLPYSVANTNSGGVTTVNLDVDGPGSNDQTDSFDVNGSQGRSFTINLPVDGSYEVTVSAANTSGDTQAGSSINPFSQTIVRDSTAPAAPVQSNVSVTQNGNQWTITFTIPAGTDADQVLVFASTNSSFTANDDTQVGELDATPGTEQTFVFDAPDANQRYFALQSVDNAGNRTTITPSSVGADGFGGAVAADDGVVDNGAATDDQTADDTEGEEQAATDDATDDGNTALIIIGLAAVAGALYYVFGRRSGIEE